MSDKKYHTEPVVTPNNMKLTPSNLDCVVMDIAKKITTKITGNGKFDDDGKKMYRDKMDGTGNPVIDRNGNAKRERVPEFETITITFTVDFTGCTLNQMINGLCSPSGIPVMVQNKNRPNGADAIRALDGQIMLYTDLIKTGRVKQSPESIIMNNIVKIKDPVARERMLKTIEELLS